MIKARKLSSAMSAAKAICDHMRDWWFGIPTVKIHTYTSTSFISLSLSLSLSQGEWTSMGVLSDGSCYGIPKDIIYSVPVYIKPDRSWEIIKDLEISDFAREKMDLTAKELVEERDLALQFLGTE